MRRKKTFVLLVVLLIIATAAFIFLSRTTNVNSVDISGYIPIKDDSLAAKYAPKFIANEENGAPYKLFYRAARDNDGNTYIAYHPVWTKEINKTKGIMPFLSRTFYTGGLKLQKIMFGKEDVESIQLKIDGQNRIIEIEYETPENYNPKSFSVTHKALKITGPFDEPLYFRIMSWNHLFEHTAVFENNNDGSKVIELTPEYFTEKEWKSYGIFKEKETMLRKNRAHFIYERISAE